LTTSSEIAAAAASILVDGESAEHALTSTLRANPGFTREERAHVADTVHKLALHRGTLHWHLHHTLLSDDGRVASRDLPAVLDLFQNPPDNPAWPTHPVERLAARRSLPCWLAEVWCDALGPEDADALAAATNERGPITLRANTLKTTRDALATELADAGVATSRGSSPHALHLAARANINGLSAWRRGLFEVQDEGSQRITELCRARPGNVVLDYCAGAGGKTLGLAAQMNNTGLLVASEVDARRLADLKGRLKRAGVTVATPVLLDGSEQLPTAADVVLVDAPCSSLGTLRRGPDVRWRLQRDRVMAFPALQQGILAKAARHVGVGGRLIYATCTIHPAENEDVAAWFSAAAPGFERDRLSTLTLMPHRDGTDGFFAACWIRNSLEDVHAHRGAC